MPDTHKTESQRELTQRKLSQQFKQLPDAEPPFGLDTRIKAQARAELEQRQTSRARQRRLGAGLATTACAMLAIVIARPLLQQPLNESSADAHERALPLPPPIEGAIEGAEEVQAFSSDGDTLQLQPQRPLDSPATSQTTRQVIKRAKTQPAVPAAKAEAMELTERLKAATPAEISFEEPAPSPQSFADTAEPIPPLQDLIERLMRYQSTGDTAEAAEIAELIERHYPDHRMD